MIGFDRRGLGVLTALLVAALFLGLDANAAAAASVSGTKTVSGTFTPGGTVTYTVVLTNGGAGNQLNNPGDEFVDVLPSDLTLINATATSGSALPNPPTNTVTWNGTLAALGGSVTITITAQVKLTTVRGTVVTNQGTINFDADGNGTNEASAVTDDPGTPAQNDGTTFTVLGPVVAATKTVSGSFVPGGNVTYSVVLSNSGDAASTDNPGDEFTDVLPASLTLVSAVATSGTALATVATNTVTWNGGVPNGGSVTITINATIKPQTIGGTIVANQGSVFYGTTQNTNVTATDDPGQPGTADNTLFTVSSPANVTGTKTVSGSFVPGGSITYSVVLSNSASTPQPDNPADEFNDVLPSSLTLVSASATSGTAVATVGTNTVTWNGLVPAGGSVTITINATIKPTTGLGIQVINQGVIFFDADGNGTNETMRTTDDPSTPAANDGTSFIVRSPATVSGTKAVSGTFRPGGTITYTVVLTNSAGTAQFDNASGNEFTDDLPSQLTLVSAVATSGTAGTSGNTVTWNGSIPGGGSVTITITATVKPDVTGGTVVSNQGTIHYDVNGDGSNAGTALTDNPGTPAANDPTPFTVLSPAAVSGTKTVTGNFSPAGNVTYTIVLTNTGSFAQGNNPGDEFVDVLPAQLELLDATGTSGETISTPATRTVTWNGSIPAGGSVTITIMARTVVGIAVNTVVSNQGTIAFDGDGDGTNETTRGTDNPVTAAANDPTTFSVTGQANLNGVKSVTGTFVRGGPVTYTIVLTNTGPTAVIDGNFDEFTDILPAALTLVSASATSGTAAANVGTNTVTWNGNVPAGGSVTITIQATIKGILTPTTVSNQATISFDADGNGNRDVTVLTNIVSFDVPVGIPTLSSVAFVGLSLLLAAGGLAVLRKRRRA